MNKEIFKPIKNYEGIYEISNYGRVKSLKRGKVRILKNRLNANKYLAVALYKNFTLWNIEIHRLVAQAFIKNPKNLPQINHKDSDKQNNYYSNLEWCSSRYNRNHYFKTVIKSSKYPGVCWDKYSNMWMARISIKNKAIYLGRFYKELDAALAYRIKLKEISGSNL